MVHFSDARFQLFCRNKYEDAFDKVMNIKIP